MALVDGCLQDITENYPTLYDAINPYSKYKCIETISEESILSEDELKNAIKAFKNSKVYQKLLSTQIIDIFKDIPPEQIKMLLGVMDRDIIRTPLDIVPEDIRNFTIRILHKVKDVTDVMMAEAILVLALRESAVACQLLFVALAGRLIILNNDNIININNYSNSIYEVMTFWLKVFLYDILQNW